MSIAVVMSSRMSPAMMKRVQQVEDEDAVLEVVGRVNMMDKSLLMERHLTGKDQALRGEPRTPYRKSLKMLVKMRMMRLLPPSHLT